MRCTGAEALIKTLELNGVDVIFGYPGAANAPVFDAISNSKIKYILPRGEQAAAHEASGYALATGRAGVCMATSGPGATNLITGIATAYLDSFPMIAITGQVNKWQIGTDAFQEVDIIGATLPFCKHSYLVENVNDIPRIINEAFYIANTGRRGPVVIDVPLDIAGESMEYVVSNEVINLRGYKPKHEGSENQVRRAYDEFKKAKKPLVIAGGGVTASRGEDLLGEFVAKHNIPVVTTLQGISCIPHCGKLHLGMIGTHGNGVANSVAHECDVMLVIGARLADRAFYNISKINKNAKIIHIDIDPAEIGKSVEAFIPVVGDAKWVLDKMLKMDSLQSETPEMWLKFPTTESKEIDNIGTINPKYAMSVLSEVTNGDIIVATEVGQNQIWAANNVKLNKEGKFLTSGGLGTMGFGLPAAIGAKVASPEKTVVAICGDGSFQMSLPELATIMQWKVDVKIIVFNNGCLGMVRELQKKAYKSNYVSIDLSGSPDFVEIAKVYGLKSERVFENSDLKAAMKRLIEFEGPYLLELVVDCEEDTL